MDIFQYIILSEWLWLAGRNSFHPYSIVILENENRCSIFFFFFFVGLCGCMIVHLVFSGLFGSVVFNALSCFECSVLFWRLLGAGLSLEFLGLNLIASFIMWHHHGLLMSLLNYSTFWSSAAHSFLIMNFSCSYV